MTGEEAWGIVWAKVKEHTCRFPNCRGIIRVPWAFNHDLAKLTESGLQRQGVPDALIPRIMESDWEAINGFFTKKGFTLERDDNIMSPEAICVVIDEASC